MKLLPSRVADQCLIFQDVTNYRRMCAGPPLYHITCMYELQPIASGEGGFGKNECIYHASCIEKQLINPILTENDAPIDLGLG